MHKSYTVTLGGQPVKIVLPSSFAICNDIREASGENRNRFRVACAALGVCLEAAGTVKPRTRYSLVDFHVLGYGGDVADELVKRFGEDEVTAAAVSAWRMIMGLDPSLENAQAEIEEKEAAAKSVQAEAEARANFTDPTVEPGIV